MQPPAGIINAVIAPTAIRNGYADQRSLQRNRLTIARRNVPAIALLALAEWVYCSPQRNGPATAE
jgi:hypothetical protein